VTPPVHVLVGRDESALVAAAKNGHAQAFEVLVARHQRRILAVAFQFMRNRYDAEDVMQQSFQKAFVQLQRFAGKSSFSTWLTRIAINEALMLLRRSRGAREVPIDDANASEEVARLVVELPDSSPDPEVSYSQRERERILSSAMNQLSHGTRRAIQLRELDERSTEETARIMGISVAAVKARVFHGRRKLRERLKHSVEPAWTSGRKTSRTISN
jgi:RNA polymerase sigma-70 factor (ECF subfamily)